MLRDWFDRWRNTRTTDPVNPAGLGTFLGVFTPTVLTILGVIMYLRFGWVLGHVGLPGTLLIVVMANSITLITTLSFSAIATNSRVGVGGAYFMISRSLGVEIGGAIGLPLFLSQAFSVTLYSFGLAESFRIVWPEVPLQPVAFVIVVAVGALSFKGATLALKVQLPVMALIAISLVALGLGAANRGLELSPAAMAPSGEQSFWIVFAVFFPAVTGIMAGLGLSGDLANPMRAIPLGAISATVVGLAVYLVVPVLLSFGADPAVLRSDPLVWARIAPLGPLLILPGLWGAIFSSAVGSMLGAPRTLQALAMDSLAPRKLASKPQDGQEPIFGLVVTLVIALGAVLIGDLNQVATVVSMFFLTVYGMVNLAAALESLSGNIAWRPRIRPPWWLSLAGALGCFAVMFLINAAASVLAIAIEIVLWLALKRRERQADWGDSRRDVYEALIRWALFRLRERPMTARNFRPHVLVFVEDALKRLDLVQFGDWFAQGRGVVTICELMQGDLLDDDMKPLERQRVLEGVLLNEGLPVFPEVHVVSSIEHGIVDVAQTNGFAGLDSNTVLLGWQPDVDRLGEMLSVMRRLERLHRNVLIGRTQLNAWPRERQRRNVHVWWGGLERNGDLMLLLAHLLTRNREWRGGRITVLSVASSELMKQNTEAALARLMPEIRIHAEVQVILKPKDQTIREIIHAQSGLADAVFLGLATPPEGEEKAYAERLIELAEGLQTFFFVKNASLFMGELVGDRPVQTGANLPSPARVASSATGPAGTESGKST
ncbi:MAG: Na-K-Cl cotransporter [Pseudomonadota bacterium]